MRRLALVLLVVALSSPQVPGVTAEGADGHDVTSNAPQAEAPVCESEDSNPQCIVDAKTNATTASKMLASDDDDDDDDAVTGASDACRLYMLPSSSKSPSSTLVTGVPIKQGQILLPSLDSTSNDLHVRIVDANKNEWSPWHDVLWSATRDLLVADANANANTNSPWLLQNDYQLDWFVAGIASMAHCVYDDDDDDDARRVNVVPELLGRSAADASTSTTTTTTTTTTPQGPRDATSGSFASAENDGAPIIVYRALRDLQVGDELVVACDIGKHDRRVHDGSDDEKQKKTQSSKPDLVETLLASLERDGVCMDALAVKPSTISNPAVGRGAFTKRSVAIGQAIARTPVIPLDKSQLEISKQEYYTDINSHGDDKSVTTTASLSSQFPNLRKTRRKHGIMYQAHIPAEQSQQLLLNYVFGSPDSNVLLLPVAPGVAMLNHAPSATKNRQRRAAIDESNATIPATQSANAYLRWWSTKSNKHALNHNDYYHALSAHDLLDENGENGLWIEIVALRDLQAGEEVFIDYGSEWEEAWQRHVDQYPAEPQADSVSASQYKRRLADNATNSSAKTHIRTIEEQQKQPYPDNLATACAFSYTPKTEHMIQSKLPVVWEPLAKSCMRFCDVLSYDADKDVFTARVLPRLGELTEERLRAGCGKSKQPMPKDGVIVQNIPASAVELTDKPYSLDFQRPHAFRHYIGITDPNFYPKLWHSKDARPDGDFIPTPLGPGGLEVIRWADTGKVVAPNAYRIGMPESVQKTLLEYCKRMGVVDFFQHITMHGNALDIGSDTFLNLDGEKWYLQRPEKKWNSNLQWLSPGDNAAHNHYLEALSVAGFDKVLESIGERFQMKGLVAFHLTFMAVSQSTRGYLHFDVTQTQAKAFNVIIPLILANETGPELDLQNFWDEDEDELTQDYRVGRYRYEYHVASMMGDDALHASSAVDYRVRKEMRLAATVYVADVNEANVNEIMAQYTQAYPPNDRELLLSWAGTHWKKDDPSVKLPKPREGHVLTEPEQSRTAQPIVS